MPPIRKTKEKPAGNATLLALGFTRVDRDVALASAAKVQPGLPPEPIEVVAPVATQDANTAAAPSQSGLPKMIPMCKGEKVASFYNNSEWDESHRIRFGTNTTQLSFGSGFELKDEHIATLLRMGPGAATRKLTHFLFEFSDASYSAHNSAHGLTDATITRLAQACPALKVVQLQNAIHLTDASLIAFLSHCPALTQLELTGGKVSGTAFTALLEYPEWCPKLKKLEVNSSAAMKPMRELSKQRDKMVVRMSSRGQEKKWGDWEMTYNYEDYKKGRKMDKYKNFGPGHELWDEDEFRSLTRTVRNMSGRGRRGRGGGGGWNASRRW
ncbi:Uu.00g132110.m01.CDS01 [Anthostomella pinea]|uniref:Uu.00g132110.m01.CDS01 n=1 Tax=Anthostomella pinea TaxID=933095 RepID=A0AAI8VJ31_9PEZI|nr:Uu.00g132110.m01.CDS01 [Anthostomella pinea]